MAGPKRYGAPGRINSARLLASVMTFISVA